MTDIKSDDNSFTMNISIDSDSFNNNGQSMDLTTSRTDLERYSSMQMDSGNHTNTFYTTSTPIGSKKPSDDDQLNESSHVLSVNNNSVATNNNNPLNEKVASLASSIYTELEKIVKLHGRDTVKDLMSILVNILEALDVAYQEKEEQIVENELLKDDYEKLLNQYEREKQSRKDTELKFFQSEDSFAEQKKEYEEKVKSLESIVRMIDLKSKNTSDHVIRLEEKENELKREYNKLHERYTELFKTHCDYMDRTKIIFGNENRIDSNLINSNTHGVRMRVGQHNQQQHQQNKNENLNSNKLIDLLRSPTVNINRNDLINTLKTTNRSELSMAISSLLSQEMNQSNESVSASTIANSSTSSLASLSSQQNRQQSNDSTPNDLTNDKDDDDDSAEETSRSKLNIQTSENFDEHLSSNCVEFDDTSSVDNNLNKNSNDLDKDYEEEEEISTKNDLSLFNELSRENYDITELDDGADLTGMTREVANLIRENSELLQTKHALNVLKDDLIVRLDQFSSEMVILREEIKSLQTVKACLQLRISELEEEAKKTKEDFAQKIKKQEEDDETVPMSQRKRFTRAEMARVLMERNQYKERLIDLQEAVRWTEMMRASKFDTAGGSSQTMPANTAMMSIPTTMQSQTIAGHGTQLVVTDQSEQQHQEHKKKTPLWKFFSDLFGSSSNSAINTVTSQQQGSSNTLPPSTSGTKITASSSSNALSPSTKKALNKNDQVDDQMNISDKAAKAYEFLKEDSHKIAKQVETKPAAKEDGRMQAYGWSLPSKASLEKSSANTSITVPVPVYCRPLFEHDNNLKLSCSSTVNFAFDSKCVKNCAEIIESSSFGHFKSQASSYFKSSCIWICNLNDNDTHVSILDANKPSDLIEQFVLKYLKIYCIQSISGANQNEYPLSDERLKSLSKNVKETNSNLILAKKAEDSNFIQENTENINYIECDYDQQELVNKQSDKNDDNDSNDIISIVNNNLQETDEQLNHKETILSSLYPTMWMGSHEGWLLVHSSISNISKTIDKIKLKDAILCIVQNGGRVVVGLADGTVAIFHRNEDGLWDLKNFALINFDKPHHSIRCLINVYDTVWCGCRNKIFVLNPEEFKIVSTIEVHPRKENQVRHMAWSEEGVWVSLRLDSTLRLYHAKTHQNLQYLDIEPFITRMLGTSNLGLSLIRISSLIIGSKRLWIGTGNGVILSLPFSDFPKESNTPYSSKLTTSTSSNTVNIPGSVVRVNSSEQTNNKIPYCNLSESQFSFHGHRNAIKFFLSVPSEAFQKQIKSLNTKSNPDSYEKVETTLILSGGHGYIDFRIGDTGSKAIKEKSNDPSGKDVMEGSKSERAHLIVWQLNTN